MKSSELVNRIRDCAAASGERDPEVVVRQIAVDGATSFSLAALPNDVLLAYNEADGTINLLVKP